MQLYLGDAFFSVLGFHVNRHKFTNPDVYDFMESFDSYLGDNSFSSKYLPWLTQSNFPVINVNMLADGQTVTLTQNPAATWIPFQLWFIPLYLRATDQSKSANNTFEYLIALSDAKFTFKLPYKSQSWGIEANFNYTAYCLINYGKDPMWNFAINTAASTSRSTLDRIMLVRGVTILAATTQVLLPQPLKVAQGLFSWFATTKSENETVAVLPLMMQRMFDQLIAISLPYNTIFPQFPNRLNKLWPPLLQWVGWDDSGSNNLKQIRSSVTFWSVFLNQQDAVNKAISIFTSNPQSVPKTVQRAVWWAAAQQNETYQQLIQLVYSSNFSLLK